MKTRYAWQLAAALFLCSSFAFGQGSCSPDKIALLDTGRPAGGASIRVCTAGSTGTPCTPTASLFTDPTLGVAASNPVTADARGNWGFCAAAGTNYDYQISCTGCTTLTVKNVPLPPTTPITAAALTSSSANPATVGQIKLASTDCLDWRNNANSGNIQLCKTGAAAGNVPADTFDMTAFGGSRGILISPNANPASAGLVRFSSTDCQKSRNAANSGDFNVVCTNGSDQVTLGSGPVIVPNTSDTMAVLGTFASPPALGNTTPAAVNATTITSTGLLTKYNNISTVSNGVPSELAAVDLTAQGANIGATTALTTPSAGIYRLSIYIITTRVATTSSTQPNVVIQWTDRDNTTGQSSTVINSDSSNTLTNARSVTFSISCSSGTTIQYSTTGYATSGATSSQYALRFKVEAL